MKFVLLGLFIAVIIFKFSNIGLSSSPNDIQVIKDARSGKALLIDVRTPNEHQSVHIKNSLLIPVDQLESQIETIKQKQNGDLNRGVVLYCRSGRRAENAKSLLESKGFTNVVNAKGVSDWPYKEDIIK